MVKKFVAVLGFVTLTVALPASTYAQDAKTFLNTVAKAMGAANLKTLQYSGSGSGSNAGIEQNKPSTEPPLTYIKSYKRQLDLNAATSRVDLIRVEQTTDHPQTLAIAPNSPWDTRYDFWLNPFGFLQGAMSHEAVVKPETVLGEKFTEVSYVVDGKYNVKGYINKDNLVEKVETQIGNNVPVLGTYLDYQDFSGVKFPTIVIQQQWGMNTLVLIVDKVKANAPISTASSN
ncbi:MAG TPA: hypothetical protein VGK48_28950 [Terriglobia bacterium]|jgi:hypothetical protein